MFKMSKLSKGCAIALSLSVMSFASSSIMAAECGPGEHWVDTCPAGTDEIPISTAVVTIEIPCGGKSQTMVFKGPTKIERQAGVPHSITTEMVSMLLKDETETITIRAGVDEGVERATKGKITEVTPTTADSYFDVFFEIDGPFGTWHNNKPHHMGAIIKEVPPLGEWHFPPTSNKTKLYNELDEEVACLDSRHALSVKLDSFTATAGNGAVALEWATGTEKDNAGFKVWRGQPLGGQCSNDPNNYKNVQAITPLVASQGTEVSGATYTMTDSNVVSGNTYCYALEDHDFGGKSTFHLDDIVSAKP
jgi:hypothetical protein